MANMCSELYSYTFPSIASLAHLASWSFEKRTNPKPLDLPEFLSYIILTAKAKKKSSYITLINYFKSKKYKIATNLWKT